MIGPPRRPDREVDGTCHSNERGDRGRQPARRRSIRKVATAAEPPMVAAATVTVFQTS